MSQRMSVPAAQWKRGLQATERLGKWLRFYEERARILREGGAPTPRPPRRRRPPSSR